ncbi:hypothetical protein [Mariluticola halotolerans]|uniref:hypothetical protein n=1 Tax=Mariluticola halotolerans TaxID=2909283 RepID=UPI0026E417E0|nr:hypothetical protein [Mariluticola halotolerans]UJQ93271.1 hypothetical protein L1P08_09675 [Mariluticola halotolerans]
MADLEPIASFWHGPLSWLERLSIASFVRQGHPFHLYSYETVEGLPEGAELRDANDVLPRSSLMFYKGHGTPGVFSDWFRMALMQQSRGIWADCDVYCVRPLEGLDDYIFSWERPGSINGAVLRIPADAPLLKDLISIFTETKRPLLEPHLPLFRRLEVAGKRLAGQRVGPEYMQYGATGPFMLTYYVPKHRLVEKVQPAEVFYPVPYTGIPPLMQAGSSIDNLITDQTRGVHIWRSQLTRRGRADIAQPEPGSALAKLCAREGISFTE